jgi:hypothetical protein
MGVKSRKELLSMWVIELLRNNMGGNDGIHKIKI